MVSPLVFACGTILWLGLLCRGSDPSSGGISGNPGKYHSVELYTENCMEPKEVGPCKGYYPRWYYDVGRTMCLQFIYGGCRGNMNNFERYVDCNRTCESMLKGPNMDDIPEYLANHGESAEGASSGRTEVCMKPKDVGPCKGYFPRWYYDVGRTMCLQFIYGGCRGNRNNFELYADCNRTCEPMLKAPLSALTPLSTSPALPMPTKDQPPVIDCVVTPWSEWTACTTTCGNGRRERHRMIMLNQENGGKPCPPRLVQRRKCKENPPCRN